MVADVIVDFGVLGKKIGQRKIMLKIKPGTSVKELLKLMLRSGLPHVKEMLINEEGDLDDYFEFAVNGELLNKKDWPHVKLAGGDKLAILMPLAGG